MNQQERGRYTKPRKRNTKVIPSILGIVILCTLVMVGVTKFNETHFLHKTYIQGVDCSFKRITKAAREIEQEMLNREITFSFANANSYTATGTQFDIELATLVELKGILDNQKWSDKNREYQLRNSFTIDEEKVKEFLQTLSQIQEENMAKPQNAYLEQNEDGYITIHPETNGNWIDFEEAYELTKQALLEGNIVIDFTEITEVLPEILSTNSQLISQAEKINDVLKTTIKFELGDGSFYVLDKETMRNWVYKTNGSYEIDIDGNLPVFLKTLSAKAKQAKPETVNFNATEIGNVSIKMRKDCEIALVDVEKETLQIKAELGTAEEYTRIPIYKDFLIMNGGVLKDYLEIDITRQLVWLYVNGKCILRAPCVTGSVAGGHDTPQGIYYLDYKTTNTYLRGSNNDGSKYASFVKRWMPFLRGYGLHDAPWRKSSEFGGTTYLKNGSHGCINLPEQAAETIYENINATMLIVVYAS